MEHDGTLLANCNGHRHDDDGGHVDAARGSSPRCRAPPLSPPPHRRDLQADGAPTTSTSVDGRRTGRRKLVLHFDVRNTILVSDSVTHDNVEQALNGFLTGVTWGRVDADGDWAWYSDRPSLRAPCSGAITYYKSLERDLVRSPADRVQLRRAIGDFTRQPIGRKFRKHFKTHLELLEWKIVPSLPTPPSTPTGCDLLQLADSPPAKPIVSTVDRKLTIVGANGRLYHYLLPSFIKLLYALQSESCHFAVVLRTFGVDAPSVLESIAHIVAGHHPLFPGSLPLHVNERPGYIHRQPGDRINCELPATSATADGAPRVLLNSEDEIYRYMSGVEGVCGFVDDFNHWQSNAYSHSHGKPLWIDPTDADVQHIFFDDNIRVDDVDSIADVRLFDHVTSTASDSAQRNRARSLALDEMAALEDVCLVQADLLQCTSNANYFVDKVRQCEANYTAWLRQHRLRIASHSNTTSSH